MGGKHRTPAPSPVLRRSLLAVVMAGGVYPVQTAASVPQQQWRLPAAAPMPAHYPEHHFDTAGWERHTEGDDQAAYDAWIDAGMPGYVADEGGAKGVTFKETGETFNDPAPDSSFDEPIPHDWSGVAECESGGVWDYYEEGHEYYGGLQFSQSTWEYFGGLEYAPRADLASPYEQQVVAERTLNGQGVGAWPSCGKYLRDNPANNFPADVTPTPSNLDEPAPVSASPLGQAAVNVAAQYVGWDYVWGGESPAEGGFDCSGLVQYAYAQVGIYLPRVTSDQQNAGWAVSLDSIQPGDLLVTNGASHIAMYVGLVDGVPSIIEAQTFGVPIHVIPMADYLSWSSLDTVRRIA